MSTLSYRKKLWSGFSIVQDNFQKKHKQLVQYNYILSEYASLKQDYSKGLHRLITLPLQYDNSSTLGNAIKSFLKLINKEVEIYANNRKTINQNIQSLENLMQDHQVKAQKSIGEYYKNESIFHDLLCDIEKTKINFHSLVEKAYKTKLTEYNDSTINTNTTKNIFHDQKKRLQGENADTLAQAKEAKVEFQIKIDKTNTAREKFIEVSRGIYDEFQTMDLELIKVMKTSLHDISIMNLKTCNDLSTENKIHLESFNQINEVQDINDFIKHNETKGYEPFELEFMEYSFDSKVVPLCISNIEEREVLKAVDSIKNKMKKEFQYEKEYNPYKEQITHWTELASEGNLNPENIALLKDLLKETRNQLIFLYCLNSRRLSGKFIITENVLRTLTDLMKIIFEYSYNPPNINYQVLDFAVIISYTYYTIHKDQKKEYIHTNLINAECWKDPEYWRDSIKYNIATQINYKNDYTDYYKPTTQEKEESYYNSAFSNIALTVDNFYDMNYTIEEMKNIIGPLCQLYQVDQDTIINQVIEAKKCTNSMTEEAIDDTIQNDIITEEYMKPENKNDDTSQGKENQ